MNWEEVLIPAAIGAAVPVLLAIVAAARWSGKLDGDIKSIREQSTTTGKDVTMIRAEFTALYERVRDIDVVLRERVSKLEATSVMGGQRVPTTPSVPERVIRLDPEGEKVEE